MQALGPDAETDGGGVILRSLLFVPADSEKKLAKAKSSPADALILDLEDAVTADNRPAARKLAADYLKGADKNGPALFVRINPLGTADCEADLDAMVGAAPAGLVVPKPDSPAALVELDRMISEREARHGLKRGRIKLVPVASETPAAVLNLMQYANPPPRLVALTWGAEDLSAALGAVGNRGDDGEFLLTYKIVRSLCLIAAKAAGVDAIETLYADFRDSEGLARAADAARREGFAGMLAIHPGQVEIINAAFTPSQDEIDHAKKVVAAFASGAGVASLDGKMLDMPHLKQAEHILALAHAIRSHGARPAEV
jgi:citrate lyase subunit beta/citryl-CoA lyase